MPSDVRAAEGAGQGGGQGGPHRAVEAGGSDPGLRADWPVKGVDTLVTVRAGGVSEGAWAGLNLGAHCGDDPDRVRQNRALLGARLPQPPVWLDQVHGVAVHVADEASPSPAGEPVATGLLPRADAAITGRVGQVLSVMTADCLPVFFSHRDGHLIGVAHAGWRGLAAGVLEATLQQLRRRNRGSDDWCCWLGPAIGPTAFEVGDEVRAAFCDLDPEASGAFREGPAPGKWWCDLYGLARLRLSRAEVGYIGGGDACTWTDAQRFYSYRRDGQTGRMASLIWRRV